jgi:hypothetical protein
VQGYASPQKVKNKYVLDTQGTLRSLFCNAMVGYLSSVAGSSTSGWADGLGTNALLNAPISVAVDSSENVYVLDQGNSLVRVINSAGIVSVIAGNRGTSGYQDGFGTAASFHGLLGATVDSQGDVYIADYYNGAIRKVTAAGSVTTVRYQSDGAFQGVAFSTDNKLYATEDGNHVVSIIATSGSATRSVFAGTAGTSGYGDGQGTLAFFHSPAGVTFSSVGVLFVADIYNYCIRKITPSGKRIKNLPSDLVQLLSRSLPTLFV